MYLTSDKGGRLLYPLFKHTATISNFIFLFTEGNAPRSRNAAVSHWKSAMLWLSWLTQFLWPYCVYPVCAEPWTVFKTFFLGRVNLHEVTLVLCGLLVSRIVVSPAVSSGTKWRTYGGTEIDIWMGESTKVPPEEVSFTGHLKRPVSAWHLCRGRVEPLSKAFWCFTLSPSLKGHINRLWSLLLLL